MGLYFLTGFVPYLFFSPVVQGGAPLAGCNAGCPTNALMLADRPTIAASYGSDGSYAVIAIMSATLICLLYRLATATRPRRHALVPVYVPALVLTVPILIFHGVVTQLLHLAPSTIWDVGWIVTIARMALPYGFVLAIVQTTFFAATALKTIVGRLSNGASAPALRSTWPMRSTTRSSSSPSSSTSRPLRRLERQSHLSRTRGRAGGDPVARNGDTAAVIMHDAALNSDPELVGVAGEALLLALDNGRLEAELRSTTSELRASRARIVAAGDAERRKLERDLHDGAQQHLVALRVKVGLASELAEAEADPEVAMRLADFGTELEEVLQELRDLAQGLYPPLLRQFGLRDALASVSRRSVPPAKLEAGAIGRYPEDVESAVYFCCLEALQNVGKHAGRDARAVVRLRGSEHKLFFEIEDDGHGCDVEFARRSGNGFTNMTDRIAALGGTLTVESVLDRGMTVRGSLPVAS